MKNNTRVTPIDKNVHVDGHKFRIINRWHTRFTKLDIHSLKCEDCGRKIRLPRAKFKEIE